MKSALAAYRPRPIDLVDGEGCFVTDTQGKRYLDLLAGWCVGNVGWKRKEVIEAIEQEARKGVYIPPLFRNKAHEEFAQMLIKLAPGDRLTRAFRCTSGSEAVDFAIKLARATTGKPTIVSIDGVYHGHTYGAASVGDACNDAIAPCVPDMIKLPMPTVMRGPDEATVLQAFESLVRERKDIAAFVSEPVWSNGGVYVPSPDFYPHIQRICRANGILFVMDEVATGFGRCGSLFASEIWGLEPDIVCLAKGLTGGYGTTGAVLTSEKVYEAGDRVTHYSTFGWLATDLAAARANVSVILRERLWENAHQVGAILINALMPLEKSKHVAEVRGCGLLIGVDIVSDKRTKKPDIARAVKIQDVCADLGVLIDTADHVLFITPPLILTEQQAEEGAAIIRKAVDSVA